MNQITVKIDRELIAKLIMSGAIDSLSITAGDFRAPDTPPQPSTWEPTEPEPAAPAAPVTRVGQVPTTVSAPERAYQAAILAAIEKIDGPGAAATMFEAWTDQSTKALNFARGLYPSATPEDFAYAVAVFPPDYRKGAPDTWITKAIASGIEPRLRPFTPPAVQPEPPAAPVKRPRGRPRKVQPEATTTPPEAAEAAPEPEPAAAVPRCATCNVPSTHGHAPGCPAATSAGWQQPPAMPEDDGGAIPNRIGRPAPAAAAPAAPQAGSGTPEYELCRNTDGSCRLPHRTYFMQGQHVPIHAFADIAELQRRRAAGAGSPGPTEPPIPPAAPAVAIPVTKETKKVTNRKPARKGKK